MRLRKLAITFPMGDKKLPGIAAEDIGKCAYGIFKKGKELVGQTVGISGEQLTGAQMAAAFSEAFGREVRYNSVSPELYRSFGFPGADEYGNMFQMYRDFEKEVNAVRSVEETRKLCGGSVQSFDQWLSSNKSAVKAATEPAPATK